MYITFSYKDNSISARVFEYSIDSKTYKMALLESLNEEKNNIRKMIFKNYKSQYILTISHELCNPINGLISSSKELLHLCEDKKRGNIEGNIKELVSEIKQSTLLVKFFLQILILITRKQLNEVFYFPS